MLVAWVKMKGGQRVYTSRKTGHDIITVNITAIDLPTMPTIRSFPKNNKKSVTLSKTATLKDQKSKKKLSSKTENSHDDGF